MIGLASRTALVAIALVLGEFTFASLLNYDTLQVAINLQSKSNAQESIAASLASILFAALLLLVLSVVSGGRRRTAAQPAGTAAAPPEGPGRRAPGATRPAGAPEASGLRLPGVDTPAAAARGAGPRTPAAAPATVPGEPKRWAPADAPLPAATARHGPLRSAAIRPTAARGPVPRGPAAAPPVAATRGRIKIPFRTRFRCPCCPYLPSTLAGACPSPR